MFDGNRDNKLGPDEINRAWMEIILPRLQRLLPTNPEAARLVDLNDDGRLVLDEARLVIDYLRDRASLQPHKASSPVDGRADANRDGRVSADEAAGFREQLVRAAVLLPPEGEVPGGQREVAFGGPHAAKSPIDKRLDANGNSKVEQAEIDEALKTQKRQDEERLAAEQKARETTPAQPAAQKPAATAPAAASAPATTAAAAGTSTVAGVNLEQVSIDEIFPVFRSYYDDHPIDTAALVNGGSTALENVKVELTAVFNDNVLKITEGTKALATVTVSYTTGSTSVSKDFVQTVQFLKLNAMTWDDDDRAAAFVTANDPVVQQLRSAVVTNVDKAVTAVDKNLRTGMALHQTLVKYGLKYWTDPNAAYETITKTKSAVDSLQFPVQTIQLKTGDCDDLSILAAALLESASVESAFITVPGHIFEEERQPSPIAAAPRVPSSSLKHPGCHDIILHQNHP
jgi:hypothetical protein